MELLLGKIWYSRYDSWRIDWIGNFTLAIETIVQHDRSFQRRLTIMVLGLPNWLSLLVAVAGVLYISRDSWTPYLQSWRNKL